MATTTSRYRCRVATDEEAEKENVFFKSSIHQFSSVLSPDSKIFGGFLLPPGYEWAELPGRAVVSRLDDSEVAGENGKAEIQLGATHTFVQPIAAVVQTISAGITLYRTRGDQLDRYGFSAFGLTVVPYLIVSIVNFFAQIAIPKYNSLYMVQCDILDEAAARCGRAVPLFGIVGKLASGDPAAGAECVDVTVEAADDPAEPETERIVRTVDKTVSISLDPETSTTSTLGSIIVPRHPSFQTNPAATKGWRSWGAPRCRYRPAAKGLW